MASDKDTIYVDIDDEITGIIDKVKGSSGKVVALVLPKRASVFQSIVNMKLLKRAADEGKKNLVLITSEAGLLPLAGASGIHVAKSLNTRPEIPNAPQAFVDRDEEFGEDEPLTSGEEDIDQNEPVGKLATGAGAAAAADGMETVTLNNDEPEEADGVEKAAGAGAAAAVAAEAAKKAAKKKDKKLKVPNFNRFRLILGIIALLIILLIIAFLVLSSSLAKASITVSTNSQNVDANLNLQLDTQADSVDPGTDTLPAKYVQEQKTYSQQVGTTGQKNEGNKATGSISFSGGSCSATTPNDIPAGSAVTSNSLTFITQNDITFQPSLNGRQCVWQAVDNTSNNSNIPIIAQSGGSNYNLSGASFTIDSYTANGTTNGGTDNMVQVVNQADINNAKNKINANNNSGVKQALTSQLQGDGEYAITATFSSGTPVTTTSANVGDAASSVTVTETVSYGMFGVHRNDLKTLVDNNVDSQINTNTQSILDDGIDQAKFTTNGNNLTPTGGQVSMSTVAIAGAALNTQTVKQEAAGKKAGDIKSAIMTDPNVTNVNVSFSPFWASSAPKDTSKINVKIAKPTSTKSSS